MKVTITFEASVEEDGYESITTFSRPNVHLLQDWLHQVDDATKGAGFQINATAFEIEDGDMVWSEF